MLDSGQCLYSRVVILASWCLMSLVRLIFAEPLRVFQGFCCVIVKTLNLPESVHFEQELSLLLFVAWMQLLGSLYIQVALLLGFEDDSQDQRGTTWQGRFCQSTTLLIALVAWTHQREMRQQRLGMLFYILSCLDSIHQGYFLSRLGSICQGYILSRLGSILYILSRLGSFCRSLAFYSISCHALAVSRGLACF